MIILFIEGLLVFGCAGGLVWLAWDWFPKVIAKVKQGPLDALSARFEAVSVSMASTRLYWMMGLSACLTGLLLWALIGSLFFFVLGAGLGLCIPWLRVSILEKQKREKFAIQLPDCLEMMAGALRSGLSLPQALASTGAEAPEPSAGQWRSVAQEVKMGVPTEEAMDHLAARFKASAVEKDLLILSTAVGVNRSVGGNLAEIMTKLVEVLRERARIREQIGALTAQGRLSGWVVGLLPVFMLLVLKVADPEMVAPLFNTPIGWGVLGLGFAMEMMGAFFIKRIVDIEI